MISFLNSFILVFLTVACNAYYLKVEENVVPPICDEALQPFGGGEGTEENPYKICSIEHLENIETEDAFAAYFLVTKDLDFSGVTWSPLGFALNKTFSGSFDGGNFSFKNLSQNDPASDFGLFNAIGGTAGVAKNLNVTDVNLNIKRGGAIMIGGGGDIINVHVTGNVVGVQEVGGLFWWMWHGNIKNASFVGNVTSQTTAAGGIGGTISADNTKPWQVSVEDCYVKGTITGVTKVGGIGGAEAWFTIYKRNFVDVDLVASGASSRGGGIVGNPGVARFIENIAYIRGTGNRIGGITYAMNDSQDNLTVGSINGTVNLGGMFAAANATAVQRNLSLVAITDTDGGAANTNAMFGTSPTGTITACFYQNDLGSPVDAAAVDLSPAQISDISNFSGFDMVTTWSMATTPWKAFVHPVPKWICGKHGVVCQ